MDDIRINKLGGIDSKLAQEVKRAKEVDLITLPKDVKGTNCGNCKWYKQVTPKVSYCENTRVKQNVNDRMCCVLWTHHGEERMFTGRMEEYK